MEPTERNRRAWDEVHRRRSRALHGALGIPEHVRAWLPDLHGRHVLHLQCGTGEQTVELAELGALVTGVDISGEALAVARERAPEGVAWVQADVQTLPLELRRARFDLVFTGGGALTWLQDLRAWAEGIEAALRTRGHALVYDEHPALLCLDDLLRWRDDYFDESLEVSVGWRHFDLPGTPAGEQKSERLWRLGQIVTVIAQAGLVVRRLEEYPASMGWQRRDARVPGEFVLVATKP